MPCGQPAALSEGPGGQGPFSWERDLMGILPVICGVNEVMSGEPLRHMSHGMKCQVVSLCWLQGREAGREVRWGQTALGVWSWHTGSLGGWESSGFAVPWLVKAVDQE